MPKKILFFDTETTGLDISPAIPADKRTRLIEISGVFDTGEEFTFSVNPGVPIPYEVTKVNGWTDAKVQRLPYIDEVWEDIKRQFDAADVTVAHNHAYDKTIMDTEAERVSAPSLFADKTMLCTVEATRYLYGYRVSLGQLHQELFGEKFDNAHNAMSDTQALKRCYEELTDKGLI